jgi:hypothetical protein
MGKRHKPEEIIAKLRQVEVMTGQGASPRGSRSKVLLGPHALGLPLITHSTGLRILLCAALRLAALLIAVSNEPSSRDDHADRPTLSTRSLSQAE